MSDAPAIVGEHVPFALFAMVGGIVISSRYFRHKERSQMQETLRAAYEKGQPVAPELIEAMQVGQKAVVRDRGGPERDLRRGIFWLAWAAALLAAGGAAYYYDPSNDGTGFCMAVAAFPGFIGLAYLAVWAFSRGKAKG